MPAIDNLIPRQPVPKLEVKTIGGGSWRLADAKPRNFTLIVFFRGLHCPICGRYLADLESKLDQFAERGVDVIAISSDSEERSQVAYKRWNLAKLKMGYGLDLDTARRWGLYISTSRGKTSIGVDEPALFSEPGLYLVRPDGT
ncbi:MAG TPA: peroxiredoxin-like family protein, partial [Alphaproteobacteria bacterium]|nr:peroxiredoxin-like family protein [Alphaproteobacteria bacterium]